MLEQLYKRKIFRSPLVTGDRFFKLNAYIFDTRLRLFYLCLVTKNKAL